MVYAGIMALVLPIKWSLFFAGGVIGLMLFFVGDVIGLALPTNLLVMDGIKLGGEEIFVSRSTRLILLQFFSSLEDCFS